MKTKHFLLRLLMALFVVLIPAVYLGRHGGWHLPLWQLDSELGPGRLALVLALGVLASFSIGFVALWSFYARATITDRLSLSSTSESRQALNLSLGSEVNEQRPTHGRGLLDALLKQYKIIAVSITDDFIDSTRSMSSEDLTSAFERRVAGVYS